MNRHALAVLEFPHVLELVAARATSVQAAARLRAAMPSTDGAWIEDEHRRVSAMRAFAMGELAWHPESIPELEVPLDRLRAAGSIWNGGDLLRGAQLLRASRATRDDLRDERRPAVAAAVLAPEAERLLVAPEAERAIERALESDGSVRDDASPTLRRVRRELRGAQAELIQLLERVMARLDPHLRVSDMSITVRNGRYVIPVRREGRATVGGIVHDESHTKGTIFVEPPAAVEFGNHVRELEAEEQDEVERVLVALTDQLRPLRDALRESLDALITLDALYARARFAEDFGCAPASLVPSREGFAIHGGRHPLLVAASDAVVPFDLAMARGERTLLLSGPNTGGKTVLLKAIGLISAMAQSGIPAPVGAESRIPIFDDCFADIGDEQSIEASLSTFSAHVRNLADILAHATANSLVLIDELGSGTDPAEGAALGGAILEELTRRRTLTVATTHLGTLKLLATELPGVVNASLQFDEERLAPTYRLIKGIPGRSFGVAIARRLQLPSEILARAEQRLSTGERDLAALLAALEQREVALAEREASAQEALARSQARLDALAARDQQLRERERTLERAQRQQARRYLLDARAEVERVIREVREGASDEAAREARRQVEALAAREASALESLEEEPAPAEATASAAAVAPGDVVEVESLGGRAGQVLELRDESAVVAVGALKLTVPRDALRRVSRRTVGTEEPVRLRGELPDVHAESDVDLRGMRVDEMERALTQALDAAVRADLKSVRIIHGKGTGALRERVSEVLRGDARVQQFRLGRWNEGGPGVTIAELRA